MCSMSDLRARNRYLTNVCMSINAFRAFKMQMFEHLSLTADFQSESDVLGGVACVAHFITGHEKTQFNRVFYFRLLFFCSPYILIVSLINMMGTILIRKVEISGLMQLLENQNLVFVEFLRFLFSLRQSAITNY